MKCKDPRARGEAFPDSLQDPSPPHCLTTCHTRSLPTLSLEPRFHQNLVHQLYAPDYTSQNLLRREEILRPTPNPGSCSLVPNLPQARSLLWGSATSQTRKTRKQPAHTGWPGTTVTHTTLPRERPLALTGCEFLQDKSHLLLAPGSPGQAWLRAGAWC